MQVEMILPNQADITLNLRIAEDCLPVPWKVWITALCNDILYLPCFLGYKSCFAKMKELLVPSCCQGAAKCTQDNILQ